MTMLTSSLVSDSIYIVDTFAVVYKFAFDFSLFHCKVTEPPSRKYTVLHINDCIFSPDLA